MRIQGANQNNYRNNNISFMENYKFKFVASSPSCKSFGELCPKMRITADTLARKALRANNDRQTYAGTSVDFGDEIVLMALDSTTVKKLLKTKTEAEGLQYLREVAAKAKEIVVSLTRVCGNCGGRVKN